LARRYGVENREPNGCAGVSVNLRMCIRPQFGRLRAQLGKIWRIGASLGGGFTAKPMCRARSNPKAIG
jgi:hypothetical protein